MALCGSFVLLSLLLAMKGANVLVSHRRKLTMPIGTVKFFNDSKGYGFIQPDGGGNDAFVHITAVESAGMRTLRENQRVSYDLEQDRRGKTAAANLKSAEDATISEGREQREPTEQATAAEPAE
jgi:CspA family cold shock protein